MNWLSQSVRYIYFSDQSVDVNTVIKIIIDKLIKVTKILLHHTKTESNYLCVAFEAFCSLYQVCDDAYKILCSEMIKRLIIKIMQRMNYYGLIDFTSGDARVDITGHFHNGLIYLVIDKQKNLSGGSHKYINTYQMDYICNKKMYMKLKFTNNIE